MKLEIRMEQFGFKDVELLPSEFKERFDVNREYLRSLDSDSLLYNFRYEAVLRTPSPRQFTPPKQYGGWEAPYHRLCRGSFLGFFWSHFSPIC